MNNQKFDQLRTVAGKLDALLDPCIHSAETVSDLEARMANPTAFLYPREYIKLLDVCRISPEKDTASLLSAMLRRGGYDLGELLFLYWQDYYWEASVTEICQQFFRHKEGRPAEREERWKYWLHTNFPYYEAARELSRTIPTKSYGEILPQYLIQKDTKFEQKMKIWFACFCDVSLLDGMTDAELCRQSAQLETTEKLVFLKKLLHRVPLNRKNGVFCPHDFYTEQFPETMTMLLAETEARDPLHPEYALLRHFLTASRIPDAEHRYFWDYYFPAQHPDWNQYAYRITEQGMEIMFFGGWTVLDNWEASQLTFIPPEKWAGEAAAFSRQWKHWQYFMNLIKEEYYFMSDMEKQIGAGKKPKFRKLMVYGKNGGHDYQIITEYGEPGTKSIKVPDRITKVTLWESDAQQYDVSWDLYRKIDARKPVDFTEEEKKCVPFLFDGPTLDSEYDIEIKNWHAPGLQYSDITEKMILQYSEISENQIANKDNGIWSYHGIRQMQFTFSNLCAYYDEKDERESEITCQLRLKGIDNVILTEDMVFPCRQIETEVSSDKTQRTFMAGLDTDRIGETIEKLFPHLQRVMLEFSLELKYQYCDNGDEDVPRSVLYQFEVHMVMVNTALPDNPIINTGNTIAIDFGTSSTCIALDDDNDETRLIALTGKYEGELAKAINANIGINLYENPTNLMVFNWESLYSRWKTDLPHPCPDRRVDQFSEQESFDFGYSVKAELSEANREVLDAVITQLKMIPFNITRKQQPTVYPIMHEETKVVYLCSETEKEDETHFDPIAFYGFLLGCAVNNPQTGKIYTRYSVTYPVKFESGVREQIRASLEAGIRRSLPSKIRDFLNSADDPLFYVDMKYSEPVAYAGAVCCGQNELDMTDADKAKLFAVFDFGGGTLDYSFCMYRFANEEEQDDGYESVLQVFGVDGDVTLGGERLINQLSYWIVTDDANIEKMNSDFHNAPAAQNENLTREPRNSAAATLIPFIRPDGERRIDGCDAVFVDETHASPIAKANTQRINERISREMFENPEQTKISAAELELFDQNEVPQSIKLAIECDVLNEKLEERLQGAISAFHDAMESVLNLPQNEAVLKEYGLTPDDAIIFLAGNASKHPLVKKLMQEEFGKKQMIKMIGRNISSDAEENDAAPVPVQAENDRYMGYRLTPKTAVAIGLAQMIAASGTLLVKEEEEQFAWYVARRVAGPTSHEPLFAKGTVNAEWKKISRMVNGETKVIYSQNVNYSPKLTASLVCSRAEEGICWIRPSGINDLEYCVLPPGSNPNEGLPENTKIRKKTLL